MTRRRIGIVTPWWGPDATGGAESLARELAFRLAERDAVTVLTTTCRSFLGNWAHDDYEPGATDEGGIEVLRFRVDPRDRERFETLNRELLDLPRERWDELLVRDAQTSAFIDESINARELEHHLREQASRYDAVLFLPYLYGVVVRGIEAYPGRAHLLPCLHDEAYARIPRIEAAVHRAATLLFNSAGEAELALHLYGPGIASKSRLVGSGVDLDPVEDSVRIEGLPARYVLYLGRRDGTKNVNMLVDAFRQYRTTKGAGGDVGLVLAGPGVESYADDEAGIHDLGFVDAATKAKLLADTLGVVQPSANESYSRVLMEAWHRGLPVAAHAECLATSTAVREAGAGWLAGDADEWAAIFERFATLGDDDRVAFAERGRRYARERADWPSVVARLREAVSIDDATVLRRNGRRIDQVLQTLEYGDAISAYAIHIRDRLRQLGYDSDIYAEGVGPLVADEAVELETDSLAKSDAVIYHHSIRFGGTETVSASAVPKAFVYHNITPAPFFAPFHWAYADLLDEGRRQTAAILHEFDVLVADSTFNAGELREMGESRPVRVIPPTVDFTRFDVAPDRSVLARGPGARWLFVGRVAPNKGMRLLLEAFEVFRTLDHHARLDIIGRYDPADGYYRELRALMGERRLDEAVRFTGVVDEAALHAYSRAADVFVSMSEHEGFCVPLLEAMMFDVPVVALASTAVPETMGAGGLLVEPPGDPFEIAVLVGAVLRDDRLRRTILAAQHVRRTALMPENQLALIDALVAELAS